MLTLAVLLSLTAPQEPAHHPGAAPSLLAVPLAFEQHPEARGDCYLARLGGHAIVLRPAGATLRLHGPDDATAELTITFPGAAADAPLSGEARTARTVHCLLGDDPTRWRRDLATFRTVRQRELWPGIDVLWHGRAGALEYDFVVAPGADPAPIRVRFGGGTPTLASNGDLLLSTAAGEVRHRAPVAFQEDDGERTAVAARYRLGDNGGVALELGAYDRSRELVIDPVIHYLARLDGLVNSVATDQACRVAVDAQGHVVVAFGTSTPDLPTRNPIQATPGNNTDVFVARFNQAGTDLVFATYLGGRAADNPGGVAILPGGDIVVACRTGSPDYPLLNPAFAGPLAAQSVAAGVTVLSPTGALQWSTFFTLPTTTNAPATDVATDALGNVVVCGHTNTLNLPMGATAFQGQRSGVTDAWLARFSGGGGFLGGTYFGLTGVNEALDVAVAANGSICVGGRIRLGTVPIQGGFQGTHGGGTFDAWLAVFNANLSALQYSTYVGGSANEAEFGFEQLGIAVDARGHVAMASATTSSNLPVSPGAWQTAYRGSRDGFVVKVDPSLQGAASRLFCTYLGGIGNDGLADVAMDSQGHCYLAGGTTSTDLPFVHPLRAHSGNTLQSDGLVAVLDGGGQALRFATSLGANLAVEGIALGADGLMALAGTGNAFGIPVTPGAFQPGGNSAGGAIFAARLELFTAGRDGYGQGHAGTLGVPTIAASADPVLGQTIDILLGNSSGQPNFCALAFGLSQDAAPTPLGGVLLVGSFLTAPFTVPLAGAGGTFPLPIPASTIFCNMPVFVQSAQIDAGASHGVAFSRGLALRLGV